MDPIFLTMTVETPVSNKRGLMAAVEEELLRYKREEKKKVIYCGLIGKWDLSQWYEWFRLDLSEEKSSHDGPAKAFIEPNLPRLADAKQGSAAVVLDSKIYVLGGFLDVYRGSTEVRFIDTSASGDTSTSGGGRREWQSAPSMRCGRYKPLAISVDGKIYVFGGQIIDEKTETRDIFGEVFDPIQRSWEPVRGPSFDFHPKGEVHAFVSPIDTVAANADGTNKRVLLHLFCHGVLCAYHLESRRWETIDSRFDRSMEHFTVVGNMLYFFSRRDSVIKGYDLICKTFKIVGFSESSFPNLSYLAYSSTPQTILHLDEGHFCFLWDDCYSSGGDGEIENFPVSSDPWLWVTNIGYIKFAVKEEEFKQDEEVEGHLVGIASAVGNLHLRINVKA